MSDPFIGQITGFGFNWAPRNWASCQGQIMSITQFTALFSLLGTYYGGDGRTNFGLPDLRGRNAIGEGAGPGLSPRYVGQMYGYEAVYMTLNELPAHTHTASFSPQGNPEVKAATDVATTPDAAEGDYLASQGRGGQAIFIPAASVTNSVNLGGVTAAAGGTVTVNSTGGNQPVSVLNPSLVINFCIALDGIFPSRN